VPNYLRVLHVHRCGPPPGVVAVVSSPVLSSPTLRNNIFADSAWADESRSLLSLFYHSEYWDIRSVFRLRNRNSRLRHARRLRRVSLSLSLSLSHWRVYVRARSRSSWRPQRPITMTNAADDGNNNNNSHHCIYRDNPWARKKPRNNKNDVVLTPPRLVSCSTRIFHGRFDYIFYV